MYKIEFITIPYVYNFSIEKMIINNEEISDNFYVCLVYSKLIFNIPLHNSSKILNEENYNLLKNTYYLLYYDGNIYGMHNFKNNFIYYDNIDINEHGKIKETTKSTFFKLLLSA